MADENPDEIDALYAVPLGEFTGARDALATRLRAAKNVDAARAVKALHKPTPAAWAVNQLARARPDDLRALFDASERLRKAQQAGPNAVREELAAQRKLMVDLVDDATGRLRASGSAVTPATVDKVQATLSAAASLNPEDRAQLIAGRLSHELERPTLESLLGSEVAPAAAPAPAPIAEAPAPAETGADAAEREVRRREDAARAAREAAQREAERLGREATEAESRAKSLAEVARHAEELAARARADAERAADTARQTAEAAAAAEARLRAL